MFYVYVLKSTKANKLYVGRTSNLKRRLAQHYCGNVWTTSRMLPVILVFYEAYLSKEDSVRRERYFKTSKGRSSLRQIICLSLKI